MTLAVTDQRVFLHFKRSRRGQRAERRLRPAYQLRLQDRIGHRPRSITLVAAGNVATAMPDRKSDETKGRGAVIRND
jgi:hypothetical protein